MVNITCVEQQWQLNSVVKILHNDKHYLIYTTYTPISVWLSFCITSIRYGKK
jgi:hypothetical protein